MEILFCPEAYSGFLAPKKSSPPLKITIFQVFIELCFLFDYRARVLLCKCINQLFYDSKLSLKTNLWHRTLHNKPAEVGQTRESEKSESKHDDQNNALKANKAHFTGDSTLLLVNVKILVKAALKIYEFDEKMCLFWQKYWN